MTTSRVAVKICDISTFDIYRQCAEIGVDFIGMVFFARSPRHLDYQQAADLARQADKELPPETRPKRVALVVDADDASLEAIIAHARPDICLLYTSPSPRDS